MEAWNIVHKQLLVILSKWSATPKLRYSLDFPLMHENDRIRQLFQTLVILLHSSKVLTSKVHSKDVKKRIVFGFFQNFVKTMLGSPSL
jgi:hypothetical protein